MNAWIDKYGVGGKLSGTIENLVVVDFDKEEGPEGDEREDRLEKEMSNDMQEEEVDDEIEPWLNQIFWTVKSVGIAIAHQARGEDSNIGPMRRNMYQVWTDRTYSGDIRDCRIIKSQIHALSVGSRVPRK